MTLERLYDMKIQLLQLRNAVVPIEDISLQLMRLHHDLIPKDMGAYFRDVHDHVARIISTLDNMREMLTAAMQVHLALFTVRQNEVVKKLAGWGAVLAVPTVVFSLYGMNFQVMPELQWHFALSRRARGHRYRVYLDVSQAQAFGLAVSADCPCRLEGVIG